MYAPQVAKTLCACLNLNAGALKPRGENLRISQNCSDVGLIYENSKLIYAVIKTRIFERVVGEHFSRCSCSSEPLKRSKPVSISFADNGKVFIEKVP